MLRNEGRRYSDLWNWMTLALVLVLSVGVLRMSPAVAQDEPAAAEPAAEPAAGDAPAAAEEAPPKQENTLIWLIKTSGWIGAIILIISFYFVAKVSQLFIELRPQVMMPPDLVPQWDQLLAKREYQAIYQSASQNNSELGQLTAAGLASLANGIDEARESIERLGDVITVNLERKISMLAVIGSLGPMIGLLGTLKGMIASFSVIAISGQQLKPSEVAHGISEALVLTFEGVAISVPAIYFFALFKNRVSSFSLEVQHMADEFVRKVYASAKQRPPA
jgi:biopolymer transport protein ExbB